MTEVLEEEWQNREEGLPYDNAYEALIMASIVERETGVAGERQQVRVFSSGACRRVCACRRTQRLFTVWVTNIGGAGLVAAIFVHGRPITRIELMACRQRLLRYRDENPFMPRCIRKTAMPCTLSPGGGWQPQVFPYACRTPESRA